MIGAVGGLGAASVSCYIRPEGVGPGAEVIAKGTGINQRYVSLLHVNARRRSIGRSGQGDAADEHRESSRSK
jgi:hypothetical protein